MFRGIFTREYKKVRIILFSQHNWLVTTDPEF